MFFSKLKLLPNERAIIVFDGSLHGIRGSGKHTVWHLGKKCETIVNKLDSLAVQWNGAAACLRFQREKAEQFWQIIDSPVGTDTLV
ncbi:MULTISPECIES: hypothetical protein [Eikenella]|uniref:Uncharacterized protein n=1 Tax=Eikenella longinqua TaxID=1795827 RepID=A0A1A9RVP9_9NEIS|nr:MULTISPECIES: hypothetical protein [Eikenella]OAM26668.1 hypothetical protein A7P95_07835 [Eikenella longinqua]